MQRFTPGNTGGKLNLGFCDSRPNSTTQMILVSLDNLLCDLRQELLPL